MPATPAQQHHASSSAGPCTCCSSGNLTPPPLGEWWQTLFHAWNPVQTDCDRVLDLLGSELHAYSLGGKL
jgi:hypothetical protein